jgi:hypothetical protein
MHAQLHLICRHSNFQARAACFFAALARRRKGPGFAFAICNTQGLMLVFGHRRRSTRGNAGVVGEARERGNGLKIARQSNSVVRARACSGLYSIFHTRLISIIMLEKTLAAALMYSRAERLSFLVLSSHTQHRAHRAEHRIKIFLRR